MRVKLWLPYLLTAGVCVALGFLLGKKSQHQEQGITAESQSSRISQTYKANEKPLNTSSYRELEKQLSKLNGNTKKARTLATIDHMDKATVERLVKESCTKGSAFWGDDELSTALKNRWAELDPDGMIDYALTVNNYSRSSLISTAFTQLADTDFATAWNKAQLLKDSNKEDALNSVMHVLAKQDPQEALKQLEANRSVFHDYDGSLQRILSTWANDDASSTADYITKLPKGKLRDNAMENLLRTWGYKDVDSALSFSEKLTSATEKNSALKQITSYLGYYNPEKMLELLKQKPSLWNDRYNHDYAFTTLAKYDFTKAKEYSMSLTNPEQRAIALRGLAAGGKDFNQDDLLSLASTLSVSEAKNIYSGNSWWSSLNAEQTKKWLEKIPDGPLRTQAKSNSIYSILNDDPDAAAKTYGELPPSLRDSYKSQYIARTMADRDPNKALAWAASLETFSEKKQAYSTIMGQLAETNPQNAMAEITKITDPKLREELMASVTSTYAKTDFEGAKQWVNTLQGEEKNKALSTMANQLADRNPEQAKVFIQQLISQNNAEYWNDSSHRNAISNVASEIADTDPNAAAKWIATLPAGKAQDTGYASLISSWAKYSPTEAGQWLAQMPEGDTRNEATQNYVSSIASYSPQTAYEWALTISDTSKRRDSTKRALYQWKNNGGKELALKTLQDNTIFTPEETKELIKAIE